MGIWSDLMVKTASPQLIKLVRTDGRTHRVTVTAFRISVVKNMKKKKEEGFCHLLRARVSGKVVRGRVLRSRGPRPSVALRVGRRPARAELSQLRALARFPRPHAGGHNPICNNNCLVNNREYFSRMMRKQRLFICNWAPTAALYRSSAIILLV